ncbi:YqjF family protein [Hazenella coriacea]|uniref:DUF2071 domain-containing protein n=1 Tax=Hazenella coriacea TaxID=1179467 RepID=A0A4V6NZ92_9BACL|nr:DUF2071 domain-containing protein [Hazenella coriacea]TCS94877.1 hypothetical protein EDD58_103300 [Hazenella coriacea]
MNTFTPPTHWMMTQTWNHVLFVHFPLKPDLLRRLIPQPLQLDTYQGDAWVSFVPFAITDMRLHYLPPIPFTTQFLQVNLRTYVKYKEKRGIYFISLDANNHLATLSARTFFYLPYKFARITMEHLNLCNRFTSHRDKDTIFTAYFRPSGSVFCSTPGSLEEWLTERYSQFIVKGKQVYEGKLVHPRWLLQQADCGLSGNWISSFHPSLSEIEPICHYSEKQTAWMMIPKKV